MNIELVEALWKSVEHWYQNWVDPTTAKTTSIHCALCNYTRNAYQEVQCEICPVMMKTGYESCDYTPWSNADTAISDNYVDDADLERTRNYIKEEYQFLVDLAIEYSETGKIELDESCESRYD